MPTDWNEPGTHDVLADLRRATTEARRASGWGRRLSSGVRLTPEAAAQIKESANLPPDTIIETVYGLPVTIDLPSGHVPSVVVW